MQQSNQTIPAPPVSADAHLLVTAYDTEGKPNSWECRSMTTALFHNRAGPALVDQTGSSYYINGVALTKLQWEICVRQNLTPQRTDTATGFFDSSGRMHAAGMPALISSNASEWYRNGVLSRTDGPAMEWISGRKDYYLDGVRLTKEQFEAWRDMGGAISFDTKKGAVFGWFGNKITAHPFPHTMPFSLYKKIKSKRPNTISKLPYLMSLGLRLPEALKIIIDATSEQIEACRWLYGAEQRQALFDEILSKWRGLSDEDFLDNMINSDVLERLPDRERRPEPQSPMPVCPTMPSEPEAPSDDFSASTAGFLAAAAAMFAVALFPKRARKQAKNKKFHEATK